MLEIDPQELLNNGVLQELNRQFLHPLGYRLEVRTNPDGTPNCAGQMSWLSITGDGDPEGQLFDDLANEVAAAKAAFVANLLAERAIVRTEVLGWVIQPIGYKATHRATQ